MDGAFPERSRARAEEKVVLPGCPKCPRWTGNTGRSSAEKGCLVGWKDVPLGGMSAAGWVSSEPDRRET